MKFTKIILQAIVAMLRALGRMKTVYPPKLKNKTRADFIERMKGYNDKNEKL